LLPFICIENESINNLYYKWDQERSKNKPYYKGMEEFEVRTMLNKAYLSGT
jgi:hypothetical protein